MSFNTILADNSDLQELSFILESQEELAIGGKARNDMELFNLLEQKDIQLIIMDIDFPLVDGIYAVKHILLGFPEIKIIIYTNYLQVDVFGQLMRLGIHGYVYKEDGCEALKKAIKKVLGEGKYFTEVIMTKIVTKASEQARVSVILSKITTRELEVLKYLSYGYSRIEIAMKLEISEKTVDKHRQNLIKKTGTKNSVGLATFAIKNKIINCF